MSFSNVPSAHIYSFLLISRLHYPLLTLTLHLYLPVYYTGGRPARLCYPNNDRAHRCFPTRALPRLRAEGDTNAYYYDNLSYCYL